MARARNIKPGFYLNEELAGCSLLARFIFPGLWMHADKAGRMEDRPFRLKAALLPYDDADMNALLSELHNAGLILRYTHENIQYIQVINFEKHQTPHVREAESTIPAPVKHSASTVQAQCEASPRSPDSLIPSSLIPSTTVEEAQAPEKPGPFDPGKALTELDVEKPVADDWLKLRKQKRAPVTQTALEGIRREAEKAGLSMNEALKTCCARGWQGFEAAWLTANGARASPVSTVAQQRDEVLKVLTGKGKSNERDITGEAIRVA